MRLRPNKSPSDPPTRISAARKSEYASTTHCTWVALAFKSVCSTGSATLTTVPSMNAMLDPRMVAASTHGPISLVLGAHSGAAWITPSSHGGLIILLTSRLTDNNISSLSWLISNSNVEKGPALAHQIPFLSALRAHGFLLA